MAVITIKKTPRSSYNDRRKPSQLLLDQIAHLEWAVLPASKRRAVKRKPQIKTEAAAAARVAQLMALLLEAKEAAANRPAVQVLPKLPKVTRAARKPAATQSVARRTTRRKVR